MSRRTDDGLIQLLTNLKVVAGLRQNERILTRRGGDCIQVSPRGVTEGAFRWWGRETREHNIVSVRQLFENAFAFVTVQADRIREAVARGEAPPPAAAAAVARITREVQKARHGVVALLATYETDRVATARLECIIQTIDEQVAATRGLIGGRSSGGTVPAGLPIPDRVRPASPGIQ